MSGRVCYLLFTYIVVITIINIIIDFFNNQPSLYLLLLLHHYLKLLVITMNMDIEKSPNTVYFWTINGSKINLPKVSTYEGNIAKFFHV